jgi:hypothetical protein
MNKLVIMVHAPTAPNGLFSGVALANATADQEVDEDSDSGGEELDDIKSFLIHLLSRILPCLLHL